MQNSKPELSVIIVNYRSERYLQGCIASLFKHLKNVDFEVIVVNNDREDVPSYGRIQVVNNGKNIGFGAAGNVGARKAAGEILWFLNPDTEIISEEINKIIHKLNKEENVGIIGPRLIDEDRKTQKWIAGEKITLFSIILNNFGYERDKKIWESSCPIECDWVSGGALFIRKKLFEKTGGFDEKFFMYFEDVDLCQRARKEGYKTFYYPEVSIMHFGGKSKKGAFSQKKQYYRSLFYYLKKNV